MSKDLKQFLALKPLADAPISFTQFLEELNEHPERADVAQGLIIRCLKSVGVEKPEDEPDLERRQFLTRYKEYGIGSLKAFRHVAGTQRFVHNSILPYLFDGADGGAKLLQFLTIVGGPGSGKDALKDGIFNALQEFGKVYAVKGCPAHENPVNLLKLLSSKQIETLAAETGLGDQLYKMLAVAGTPCDHCYRAIMGDINSPNLEPNLDSIMVEKIQLSPRSFGVAEWEPGQDVTLIQAFRHAQRGIITMPDFFIARKPKAGETDERLVLLGVTQYRRLPARSTDSGKGVESPTPLDTVILATTNEKAFTTFLDTLDDKNALTSRMVMVKQPYNLVRIEEERAYKAALSRQKKMAHFDPLALRMLATLSVISRQSVPSEGKPFANPIDKLRLYQGEQIDVKPRPASEWPNSWSLDGTVTPPASTWTNSSSSTKKDDSSPTPRPELSTDSSLTLPMLWANAGPDEGLEGLDMRYMLSLLSTINSIGLKSKHKCVNSLTMIGLLRSALSQRLGNKTLTAEQVNVTKRCLRWLGLFGKASDKDDLVVDAQPSLIESEFRRLLKQILLRVIAPDYATRAQQIADDYKLHATAAHLGDKTVKHPKDGVIGVKDDLADELDRLRVGKKPGEALTAEDKRFRGGLEVAFSDARDEFIERALKAESASAGEKNKDNADKDDENASAEQSMQMKRKEIAKKFKPTWETIPELAEAIRKKLDADVAKLADKLLSTEVVSDLPEDQQNQLIAAKQKLEDLGFCKGCLPPVLEYAKRTKVWTHKG